MKVVTKFRQSTTMLLGPNQQLRESARCHGCRRNLKPGKKSMIQVIVLTKSTPLSLITVTCKENQQEKYST